VPPAVHRVINHLSATTQAPRKRPLRGPLLSAALLIASSAALMLGGCGSDSDATPAATHLEREDFAAVSHALGGLTPAIDAEVKATKAAWPLLANGLPANPGAGAQTSIHAAALRAAQLTLPAVFSEARAASLTGPAAHLAGLFRSFRGLTTRGWQLIEAALLQGARGPSAAARFARTNVALYIESLYDGHFSLAQIGRELSDGYAKLGGAPAFGETLTEEEVDRLLATYSEASDRLHPHVGVRLGS
jgi:hypothetical protein